MRIGIAKESEARETRVAATPETVKKFVGLGAATVVARGAGLTSGITDADYEAAGAALVDQGEALAADVVLKVRRPDAEETAALKRGALLVAIMDPYGQTAEIEALAKAGVAAFAMELMPRITRAQVMDVLSSQANLAGYRAVIDAAEQYGRAFPMMMTAAGTVPAAKVFIMGVGVAGLQAIATARRLGAIVTATDVRPATKEQVESLGAKFVAVEDEEFKQAETAGGYAKEMSDDYKAKQAALVATHIAKQDIVITTALIPGRPAPRLVTADDGRLDAARLGGRRPRGRARRQLRAVASPARSSTRQRRQDRRLSQRRRPARRDRLEPLRPQPLRLRRDADRQGQRRRVAVNWDDELVQGDLPDPRRRGRPSEFPAARPPDARRARERRRQATDIEGTHAWRPTRRSSSTTRRRPPPTPPSTAADAAQAYAIQLADIGGAAVHAASGGAIDPFVFRLAIFAMAVFVGYYVVWSVTPALHTPLMSVTNAISSVIVVGALLLDRRRRSRPAMRPAPGRRASSASSR